MNNILGYLIAIIIGFIMGIMGAGGAIITIPVLVYLFKIEPVLATSYSLFIVGVNSFFGVLSYNKKKLVQFKIGLLFFIPSIIGISLSRRLILPNIPKEIFYLGNFLVTKSNLLLLFFSIIMILSAYSMIKKEDIKTTKSEKNYLLDIFIKGLVVGLVSGFIGVGGGFLIIPALVISLKLDIKEAVGTSLFIISINSLFSFLGDLFNHVELNWNFLIVFSFFTMIGVFSGIYISNFIPNEKLKLTFGWFVLFMGFFIFLKEFLF